MVFICLGLVFSPRARALFLLRKEKSYLLREPLDNCFWIHCSSGEFEYAKPLIREIKIRSPQTPILVTYFSTSFVKQIEEDSSVDVSCALPWDFPAACSSFLEHFNPQALLIARCDLWPEMLQQCKKRNIPSYLFSAQCKTETNTFKRILKKITQSWMYHSLEKIYCINKDHAQAFSQTFSISDKKINAAGDTRFDQVFYRLNQNRVTKDINPKQKPHFILGSSWPEDEKFVFESLKSLIETHQLQLTFVPHQFTEKHLASIEKLISPHKYNLYSQAHPFSADITIIDQVGILAETYLQSDFCFVGGSIQRKVHSVMEPLAAGNIVFVGLNHKNNAEAILFSQTSLNEKINTVNIIKNPQSLLKAMTNLLEQNKNYKPIISDQIKSLEGASQKIANEILNNQK